MATTQLRAKPIVQAVYDEYKAAHPAAEQTDMPTVKLEPDYFGDPASGHESAALIRDGWGLIALENSSQGGFHWTEYTYVVGEHADWWELVDHHPGTVAEARATLTATRAREAQPK